MSSGCSVDIPGGILGTAARAGLMGRRLAVLFPGQGTQYVGMLNNLHRAFPKLVHDLVEEASSACGFDIGKLIDEGPTVQSFVLHKLLQVGNFDADSLCSACNPFNLHRLLQSFRGMPRNRRYHSSGPLNW